MKKYDSTAIRNVAFLGHGDSGKTSLVSALLFNSGTVNRLGSVNDGSTITDYSDDEISRKISIGTALAFAEYNDHKLNLIDTPGFANFIHEAKAALPVADAGLITVCAVSGVEVMTERVYRYCREQHKPTAFVVNKIDRDNANFEKVLAEIQEIFDRRAVAVQYPLGQESACTGIIDLITLKAYSYKGDGSREFNVGDIPAEFAEKANEMHVALEEMIAENDEELMDHYFEVGKLTEEEMAAGLRRATIKRQLFPVFCVSATHNIGATQLMDALINVFPNPLERGEVIGLDPGTRAEKVRTCAADAPFFAYVFKTIVDPFTGRINLFRIYSGSVVNDASVFNVNRDMNEKLSHLMIMQGKKGEQVEGLATGDIGAVAKLRETHTGDVFCDPKDKIIFEPVTFPDPVFSFALEPKSRGDEEKISSALARLQEEDIMLRSERDSQTKELLVRGTGQLHIEVVVERLKTKFNCDVILHPPKIAYRETILGNADVRSRYKKQSGGRGQFAECAIKLEPNERGKGYEFVDSIFGGSIPQNFRPAVDKGIQETMAKGVIAGYQVVDVKVILYDGKDHPVDSSEMAFKTAGSMAFKEAMRKAKPALLEPVMSVEITIPEENTGDIMGDLSTRRGRPLGMDAGARGTVIKALVPMAEMLTYGADLTSVTGGRGSFTMEFSHLDVVPSHSADKIIAQAKVHDEEEE